MVNEVQADLPGHVVETVGACAFVTPLVLGGALSMDVAKLVALLRGSRRPLAQMYSIDRVEGERLSLVQVPTTMGFGPAVTQIAIVITAETTRAASSCASRTPTFGCWSTTRAS